MTEIEKTEGEIKVLQAKLELLKEIETHKSQPRMTYVNEGKVEIVSYNDMTYYRLDLPDDVYWYISKRDVDDAILLKQVTYGETHRLLEGLWFNEVKRGSMTETDISTVLIDGEYVTIMGVKYKRVEEPKPETLYEALDEVYYGTTYVPRKEDICRVVERWLPDEFDPNEAYEIGWNEAIQAIKEKLR